MSGLINYIKDFRDIITITNENREVISSLLEIGLLSYDVDIDNKTVTTKINDEYRWVIKEQNKGLFSKKAI